MFKFLLSYIPALPFFVAVGISVFLMLKTYKRVTAQQDRLFYKSDFIWAAAHLLLALVLGIWMLVWPFNGNAFISFGCAAVLLLSSFTTLSRRHIVDFLRTKLPFLRHHVLLHLIFIAFAGVFAQLALEFPWNTALPFVNYRSFALEFGLIFIVLLALYFLNMRAGIAPTIAVGLFAALGVVQAVTIGFKGAVLAVGDLYAFNTALSVSSGYAYPLDGYMLGGIIFADIGGCFCSLIFCETQEKTSKKTGTLKQKLSITTFQFISNVCVAALLFATFACAVFIPNYQNDLGIKITYWWGKQLPNHKQQGFLPSTIAEAQDIPIKKPKGYSAKAARQAEERLNELYQKRLAKHPDAKKTQEQWSELEPSVVVVMNETFSDLSHYGDLNGYQGPQFFNTQINDALFRGQLAVSVNGGGTCNSEFEFLTGQSMAFLGTGKYPYTIYDLSQVETLPKQFKDLGYDTTAIHPNLKTNWNRENIYQQMGFDNFLDISQFEDATQFHNTVADSATYDQILDILNSNENPQFIFNITMQNHSGYDQGGIPISTLNSYTKYGSFMIDSKTNQLLTEYLACIGESDRALGEFMSDLKNLDRPVILIFFGDHQPYFSNAINDAYFSDEGTIEHEERPYQSDYVVWANYDVAGVEQTSQTESSSASDLAAKTLSLVGAPLTTHQEHQLASLENLSALNLFGYQDLRGKWHSFDAATNDLTNTAQSVRDLHFLFYRDFAKKIF